MNSSKTIIRRAKFDPATAGAFLACALVLSASAAQAATGSASPTKPAASKPTPTQSVVVNLIRLLVQQGVLTQEKADALIRQAEDEAAQAARGEGAAVAQAGGAHGTGASVRVPYIPEVVKKQIREEVKQEVMQQARDEHWAAPNALPEWTQRIKLSGDVRFRQQWDLFDKRNVSPILNFTALNAGSPFDLNNQLNVPLPILNTSDNRERQRVRFRLGIQADLDDGVTAGVRLATGNTTNPVSTNQTLGNTLANDNFNLDRAYLRYQPASWGAFWAGRMPNPWYSTDLVWDEDLNFDGVAAQFSYPATDDLTASLTLGVFSIENTSFNFPDNSIVKQSSRDKWLYAAQAGAEWKPEKDYAVRVGLAYYHFQNVEGQTSSPCNAISSSITCSTDNTRPGFMQQGNTLFALRNLISTTTNTTQYQYFGLASQFHELDLTARFDYAAYDPIHMLVDLDFVTNLGFSRGSIISRAPVNNLAGTSDGSVGPWEGGQNGLLARLTVGYPVLRERGQWNVFAGYKYLESDAVLDAFTDSDFHLGGTNAKGYFIGGGIGIAKNFDLSARWYSAREISGLPYSVDTVQIDLNGRF